MGYIYIFPVATWRCPKNRTWRFCWLVLGPQIRISGTTCVNTSRRVELSSRLMRKIRFFFWTQTMGWLSRLVVPFLVFMKHPGIEVNFCWSWNGSQIWCVEMCRVWCQLPILMTWWLQKCLVIYCWWFRNPARTPVEVGSLSHLTVFF